VSKAPSGAFGLAPTQPAMTLRPAQGSIETPDASPTRIARMLREVFEKEKAIRAWEDMSKATGKRYAMYQGKMQYVETSKLVGDSLATARAERDDHIAEIARLIDHALNVDAFKSVPCPNCRLPYEHLAFVEKLVDFEVPAMPCTKCQGVRTIQIPKTDKYSKRRVARIKHFQRVLDETSLCAKVRMGTADADTAYSELEARNHNLLVKFGNEKQTSLEGADAEQGVRQGIVDAAMRFDPTREEMATFNTVAYNWCRRNSRARSTGHKRAGVYAPSIDGMAGDEDGCVLSTITSSNGAFGTFEAPEADVSHETSLDVRAAIDQLPADQQQVVLLQLAETSTSEIADELKISKSQVRKLREEAFSTLRGILVGYSLNG